MRLITPTPPSMSSLFALILLLLVFAGGCASLPGSRPGSVNVEFQAYDLSGSFDPNEVIEGLQRSYASVLGVPANVIVRNVPPTLPVSPADFVIEQRRLVLDQLGPVLIPHVVCADAMAVVHVFHLGVPSRQDLHLYAGCIQPYRGGYRIHLVDARAASAEHPATLSKRPLDGSGFDVLSQIGEALVERLPGAKFVQSSHTSSSPSPALLAPPPTIHHEVKGDGASSDSPLVCLAPVRPTVPIRSQPGAGKVIGTFRPSLVLDEDKPVNPVYYPVGDKGGITGWVSRSDLRRAPCPIG